MAKLYGQNTELDFAPTNLMSFGKSFSRLNGQPLDKSEVWYDKSALEAYAKTDAAYVSQKVAYVDVDNNKVFHYSIEIDGNLKELGSTPIGDKKTIVIAEDGTISLAGVSNLEFERITNEGKIKVSYQPLLVDGVLTWIEPNTTTVEGLAAEIENIKTRLGVVENTVGNSESGLVKDVSDINVKIGILPEGKTLIDLIEESQYDDTTLSNRVKTIEDDYLKVSDKTDLENQIVTAKTEVIETILGGNVNADFDTLQEVAAWIQSDTTSSVELISRISNIESDYLKGTDKTELQNKINELESFVGDLPEDAVSTDVITYVKEVVDGLNIEDYAKANTLIELADKVDNIGIKLQDIDEGAQVNVIDSVDENQFIIDETKKLTLQDISISKVIGLEDALKGKVTAEDGKRLITEAEGKKLESLVVGEDGSVEISGTVNASNVQELYDKVTDIVTGIGTGTFDEEVREKLGISKGAQVNVIEGITVNNKDIAPDENKKVNIPLVTTNTAGVVVSSDAENKISASEDGTMEVNSLNVNKLVQAEGDELILDGGDSQI